MHNAKKALIISLAFLSMTTGCVSLRTGEKYEYTKLETRLLKVGLEPEKTKDSTMAGVLNVLPGVGNAYLGQWGLFAMNLLLWPLSISWGIPQAAVDANSINKQDTLYFYGYGDGKAKLEELEKNNK